MKHLRVFKKFAAIMANLSLVFNNLFPLLWLVQPVYANTPEDPVPTVIEEQLNQGQENKSDSSDAQQPLASTPTPEPTSTPEPTTTPEPTPTLEPSLTPAPTLTPAEVPENSDVGNITPNPELTPSIAPAAESTLTPTRICLTDQEIKPSSIEDWNFDEKTGIAETKDPVKLGVKYQFPGEDKMSVTFTCLPETTTSLKIERIKISDLKLPEGTTALGEYAYDVTTGMDNGSFEYDITLPKPEDKKVNVVYLEKSADEVKNQPNPINTDEIKPIEENKLNQNVDSNNVEVKDLDHFTIYIVTNPKGPTLSTAMVNGMEYVSVPPSTNVKVTLKVKTEGEWGSSDNDWKTTQYSFDGIDWICVDTPDHYWSGTWEEDFKLTAPATVGSYDLHLKVYNGDNCTGGMSNTLVLDDAIRVVASLPSLTPPTLISDPSDPVALTSVNGIWTNIEGGSGHEGKNTNEIRWGTKTGSQKSGLKFTNSGNQSFDTGDIFYLGMLTHMNWPVKHNTGATGATLQITLNFDRPNIDDVVLDYDFDIEETPNTEGECKIYQRTLTPCDDRVTFPNKYGTEFTIGDIQYTLVIDGFVDAYPSGNPVNAFITEEKKDNSAFLVGHLSSVLVERPEIKLTKKTNDQDVASAPGPNLYIGDTVEWKYIVQNSGNVTLSNISITDNPVAAITCYSDEDYTTTLSSPYTLESGKLMYCKASGKVVEGQYQNTATVTGTPPTGSDVSASDSSWYYGVSKGSIKIVKTTVGGDGTFNFTSNFGVTSLTTTNGTASQTVSDITPGQYSISETVPTGWNLDSITCDDHNSGSSAAVGNTANINVEAGETVTCTFKNVKQTANLTLVKEVVKEYGGNAGADDFGISVGGTVVNSGAKGTYTTGQALTINETGQNGYEFVLITGDGKCPTKLGGTITLAPGDDITCTIKNKDIPATLTVCKFNDKDGDGIKDDNEEMLSGWTMTLQGPTPTSGVTLTNGCVTFNNLSAGNYSVTETNTTGWHPVTGLTQNVTLSLGDTKTVYFGNQQLGSIAVYKDVVGPNGENIVDTTNNFKVTLNNLSKKTITDGGQVNYDGLVAGNHTISESYIPNGYEFVSLSVNNQSVNNITVTPGETTHVYIVNKQKPATLKLIKEVKNKDGFGNAKVGDFTLKVNGNNVSSGQAETYAAHTDLEINEETLSGYSLENMVCTSDVSGSTNIKTVTTLPSKVNLVPGESVTCTITNVDKQGKIIIEKQTSPDGDTTEFSFSGTGVTENVKLKDGETTEKIVAPGEYTVTESLPDGWDLASIDCGNDNDSTGDVSTKTANINVSDNETVKCVFTNTKHGSITIKKDAIPNAAQDFTFTRSFGEEFKLDDDNNATLPNEITFDKLTPGEYWFKENSHENWILTDLECNKNKDVAINLDEGKVTIDLEAGENVICTFTNKQKPKLTVVKKVINDNGGTKTVDDFGITFSGGKLEFNGGTGDGNSKTYTSKKLVLNPGTYILSEKDLKGYEEGKWDCGEIDKTGRETSITLSPGKNVTCTITNNDIAPTLKVVKKVINDNGGTATADDFYIKLNDKELKFELDLKSEDKYTSTYISTPEVESNIEYTLKEIDHPGYKEGKWSCEPNNKTRDARQIPREQLTSEQVDKVPSTSFTLSPGEDLICTITNDDIAPKLELVKNVKNDNGGGLLATDWILTATGPTTISGNGGISSGDKFKAGTYTLSEKGETGTDVSGYQAIGWSCTNGIKVGDNNGITLGIGQSTVCTITNDDVAPTLKLVKNVDNGHGGPSNANDWTLTAKSETEEFSNLGDADTTHTVTAGVVYTLSETGPEKYEAEKWECTNNIVVDNNNGITLGLGQSTVCTITNTYSPVCIDGKNIGADIVASVVKGKRYDGGDIAEDRTNPGNALGVADGKFYSLGEGGKIVLAFTGYVENVAGNDFSIYETTWGRESYVEERAEVWVAKDIIDIDDDGWIKLGEASNKNEITHFDFGSTGLPWIRAIKLVESSVKEDQTNGDGFDLNAVVAASHVCKKPSVSQVKICKVDNKNRPLSGWDVMLKEKVDGPTPINVKDGSGTDSTNLPAGKYLIKVSGTYRYGNSSMNADAGFSYRPNGIPSGCNCWLDGREISNGLMALVNGQAVNWGAYNDGHVYTYVHNHSSAGAINISILDNIYGDNVNDKNFQFEIFRIPEGYYGTTGDNGCVTLSNVLYGDYILDEILKEGWINVSGKGSSVSVDSSEEIFTLVNRKDAPVTIVATKIVCDDEAYLPNYGTGGPNMTAATAQNWVNQSQGHCRLESGWSFQWGNDGSVNPGDAYTGEASGWHTFGPTGSDGVATVKINDFGNTSQIKVREVLKENYIPFTYLTNKNNSNNVSAEIYCHTDVFNYDNDDRFTPEYGNTYHCVAWNVEKNPLLSIVKTGVFVDGNNNGFAEVGETINYSFTVKNEGNVTLTNVTVTDPKVTVVGGPITLSVGQTDATTFTASYVLTQDDVDTGKVDNTATADSNESEPATDDETVTLNTKEPKLTVVKKVINDNGGDATINDFEIKLNDDLITFEDGAVDGTTTTYTSTPTVFTKTEYTLSEKDFEGYEAGDWSCIDDTEKNIAIPFTLSAGQNVTCTITNDDIFGQISVIKFNDVNGNGQMDAGEETLSDWQINLTSQDSKVTNDQGSVVFNKLIPQTYYLSETLKDGWTQTVIDCGQNHQGQVKITAPGEAYGHHGHCYGWNGCGDAATCAQWACEAKGYQTLVSYGEDKGCTNFKKCNLFHSRNNVDYNWKIHCDVLGVTDIVCSNPSSTSPQVGQSLVKSVLAQTVNNNYNNYQIVLDKSKTVQCYIGNRLITPKLDIAKTNNVGSSVLSPGDSVTYTIKLEVSKNDISNLKVTDLLSNGFKYRPGSYKVIKNGTEDITSQITEPQYHSPGLWDLGSFVKGDKLDLIYIADINSNQQSGIYKDIAWAVGNNTYNQEETVLASALPEGYLDTNFVGTQVPINKAVSDSVSAEVEKIQTIEGQVLGVSTDTLPATGATTIWLLISSLLGLTGLTLIFSRHHNMLKKLFLNLILTVFALGFTTSPIQATDPSLFIRLQDPKAHVNTTNLDLKFVTLDINSDRQITVRCFKKGPTESTFSQFGGDIAVTAGGNSDQCNLASIISTPGTYQFQTKAYAGADVAESNIVFFDYQNSTPGTPGEYSKSVLDNHCDYTIKFRTANDEGRTAKVEIYRSTNPAFAADNQSLVHSIDVGSDQYREINNSVPDCSKTYYYAIRAFDIYGNGSGVTGDTVVKTIVSGDTTVIDTTTSSSTDTTGAIRVSDSNIPQEEDLDKKDDSEQTETVSPDDSSTGQVLGVGSQSIRSYFADHKVLTAIIIIACLALIVYVIKTVSNRSKKF